MGLSDIIKMTSVKMNASMHSRTKFLNTTMYRSLYDDDDMVLIVFSKDNIFLDHMRVDEDETMALAKYAMLGSTSWQNVINKLSSIGKVFVQKRTRM